MAGVAGRSGGHNRLSEAEHRLRGTYRRDRHRVKRGRFAGGAPRHLAPEVRAVWREVASRYAADADPLVVELLAEHVHAHRTIAARLASLQARIDAGELLDATKTLRTLRQEAALVRAIAVSLRAGTDPEPDDQFSEFFSEVVTS